MVKLKRLKIDKFRNVAPGTELRFRDSLNVLLGKNGTGKTTLLNLIVAVLSGRFGAFRDEAFKLEYELEASHGKMKIRFQNQLVESEISPFDEQVFAGSELPISDSPESIAFRGTRYNASCEVLLQLAQGSGKYKLIVEGNDWVLREGATELLKTSLDGPLLDGPLMLEVMWSLRTWTGREPPLPAFSALSSLLLEIRIEGLSRIQRFDESLAYLDELTQSKSLFEGMQVGGHFSIVANKGAAKSLWRHLKEKLDESSAVERLVLRDRDAGMDFLARAVRLMDCNRSRGESRLRGSRQAASRHNR